MEPCECRTLLTATSASAIGYLPDYELGSGTLLSTLVSSKFEGLTQVNYFSVLPTTAGLLPGTSVNGVSNPSTKTSGGYSLTGSSSQLRTLVSDAHADGVKVNVVIGGGGSQSNSLTTVVEAGGSTWSTFATSVSQFAATYGIDGVDLDWEPSSLGASDRADYGGLIAQLRTTNPTLSLSAAVNSEQLPVSSGGSAYVLNATAIQNLTNINVMAYDLEAGNTSPIGEAENNLTAWGSYTVANGGSKSQLIFGMPFYGSSGSSWANTVDEQYAVLISQYGSLPSPSADSVTINGVVWNYNGPNTISNKTAFALDNGYGGVTTWEIGQDYFTSSGSYDNTYSLLPQVRQAVIANTGSISGTVLSTSGTPVANETVYLDTNNNGVLDTGEPSTTTSATGTYSFSNLLIGSYKIREVLPAGYTQTSPASNASLSRSLSAGASLTANFTVAAPLTSTAVSLVNNGSSTSDATQVLSLTATITGGVPDGESLTLKDASNNNAVVATATSSGGNATFTVPAGTLLAGTHNLFAAYGGDSTFAASQSKTVAQNVQVVVSSMVVNGNVPALTGVQRSMVDGLLYTFSEPVNVGASAFSVAIHMNATGIVPTLSWSAVNANADGSATQWAVSFSGNGVVGNSIANGSYDVTMNAAAVTSDSAPTITAQSRSADTFFRLFGDSNGDGTVNLIDYRAFITSYLKSSGQTGFNSMFDANGDGTINLLDYRALISVYLQNATM